MIIQIEGFRPVSGEVTFLEMTPKNGDYEPLLGYITLEQSQAAVDLARDRLVPVKYVDLKAAGEASFQSEIRNHGWPQMNTDRRREGHGRARSRLHARSAAI